MNNWLLLKTPIVIRARLALSPFVLALGLSALFGLLSFHSLVGQQTGTGRIDPSQSNGEPEQAFGDPTVLSVRSAGQQEPLTNLDVRASAASLRDSFEQPSSDILMPLGAQESGRKNSVRVGYEDGFLIASDVLEEQRDDLLPFRLKINGWGQLRITNFVSQGLTDDLNQIQLKRARVIFSGHAFTPDFSYFIQLDGRSSSGDEVTLLDYYLNFDMGHHWWTWDRGTVVARVGKYKMPFHLARHLSSQELQFTDRSMASTYFDVNRSLACGLYGEVDPFGRLVTWETAIFNGLITGGAETGSAGDLDNNFAVAARIAAYPYGDWGTDDLADFECHATPATRIGVGMAFSTINREGSTEFSAIRVVDSGQTLSSVLPNATDQYSVALFAVDASMKYLGWSLASEYYFRNVSGFEGIQQSDLFDHGFWLEAGYFLVPQRVELLARWSRVMGDSGTLGATQESSDERGGGVVFYFRRHHAKLTIDGVYLDGAPISSAALDEFPGDRGWLFRTQIQFSF